MGGNDKMIFIIVFLIGFSIGGASGYGFQNPYVMLSQ